MTDLPGDAPSKRGREIWMKIETLRRDGFKIWEIEKIIKSAIFRHLYVIFVRMNKVRQIKKLQIR